MYKKQKQKQKQILFSFIILYFILLLPFKAYALQGDWVAQAKLSDGIGRSHFGSSIAIDGDTAIIGTSTGNYSSERAYIYIRSGATWTLQASLAPNSGNALNQGFGHSVAISGDIAIVGETYEDSIASNSGAAYIFTRSGSNWVFQQKIKANDPSDRAYFGGSVAISGNSVIIGATGAGSGAAYIFSLNGTVWTQQTKLTGTGSFGRTVAIDNNTAVVSAIFDNENGIGSGAVYTFTRSGTSWSQQQKLASNDIAENDLFGFSIDIKGNTLLVGAARADANELDSGASYIFSNNGNNWQQLQKLSASDGTLFDRFGSSGAISADEKTIVIGVPFDQVGSDLNSTNRGSSYIFSRNGTIWSEQQKLFDPNGVRDSRFGFSVAIDGGDLLIGANGDDIDTGADAGAVFVYSTNQTQTNTPPVAIGSASKITGFAPLTVNFNGSKSYDFDGFITSYEWDFKDGSPVLMGSLVSHTFNTPGVYTISLIVTDDSGEWSEDTIDITVTDPVNIPPEAIANADITDGNAPLTVNFDSINSNDADGFISTYEWDFKDGSSISNTLNPTHIFNHPGTYNVSLKVTDDLGASNVDTITITVSDTTASCSSNCLLASKIKLKKRRRKIKGAVKVKDENGKVIRRAVVEVFWTLPNGSIKNQVISSNSRGVSKFSTAKVGVGIYTLTVTNISKGNATFDTDNSIFSKSIRIK